MGLQTTARAEKHYSPKFGSIVAVMAATVGVIYGYDNGSISGALPFLTKQYHLTPALQGAVTSTAVLGSIIGAVFGGRIADTIGRKKMMLLIALGFTVFALFSAVPVGIWWLLPVRFCIGLCIGASVVAAPLFIAEFAPAKIRGSLLVSYQIAQTIGIIAANFIDFGFSFSGNWELMLGISCIPAFLVTLALIPFPDTPRWYLMKGRREKGIETLQKIEPPDNVASELAKIDEELKMNEGRFREIFQKRFLKAAIFVIVFGFLVQITGINAIVYYAPIIFKTIGLATSTSILSAAIIQVSSLLAELISFFLVDRWGRRPTLLTGIGAMVMSSLVMAVLFFAGHFDGAGIYLAFLSVLVFNMGFNFGMGSLVWIYASECFPARLRAAGASALLTADLIANFVVAQVFISALHAFGGGWTFFVFMILSLAAWFFIFILAPETKGRSLEEIHNYWDNGGSWNK